MTRFIDSVNAANIKDIRKITTEIEFSLMYAKEEQSPTCVNDALLQAYEILVELFTTLDPVED